MTFENLRPGDVVLYHRPFTLANLKRDPLGTIFVGLIHLTTGSKWNHTSIAVENGLVIEATGEGVVVNPAENTLDEAEVVPVTYRSKWALARSTDHARSLVGRRYGYLNAFMVGLRNLFPGRLWVRFTDTMICSELVAECLDRGDDDRITEPTASYSPGDIAEALGVER